jgi:type I restriction enzyme S subunit
VHRRSIAAIVQNLDDQFSLLERARTAAEAQLETAQGLVSAKLRETFGHTQVAGWRCRALEEIAETGSGATPPRGRLDYYKGTIPWVKTGELVDGMIDHTEEQVTESALADTSLRVLPAGTLLVAMYGQGQTRGRTGLLTVPATTNQACFAILPNPSEFHPRFVQCWFRYKYQDIRSETEGRGGNQPNLNGQLLKAQRIPLPTIPEQVRIAAQMDEFEQKATSVTRLLEKQSVTLGAFPAAILRVAFNGELR